MAGWGDSASAGRRILRSYREQAGGRPFAWYGTLADHALELRVVLDPDKPEEYCPVAKRMPVTEEPFTPEAAPIVLTRQAMRIPDWGMELNCVAPLPKSPVASKEPVEDVELIPMGCAPADICLSGRGVASETRI